jgi:hypothetical protein
MRPIGGRERLEARVARKTVRIIARQSGDVIADLSFTIEEGEIGALIVRRTGASRPSFCAEQVETLEFEGCRSHGLSARPPAGRFRLVPLGATGTSETSAGKG